MARTRHVLSFCK
jgi:U3 small nucleolar RNA-associated protein 3